MTSDATWLFQHDRNKGKFPVTKFRIFEIGTSSNIKIRWQNMLVLFFNNKEIINYKFLVHNKESIYIQVLECLRGRIHEDHMFGRNNSFTS
jgi:hypothetical protein